MDPVLSMQYLAAGRSCLRSSHRAGILEEAFLVMVKSIPYKGLFSVQSAAPALFLPCMLKQHANLASSHAGMKACM